MSNAKNAYERLLDFQRTLNVIDDCIKDGGKEFLPTCIAFFNRHPIESLCNLNAAHLGEEFLAAIVCAIVYQVANEVESANQVKFRVKSLVLYPFDFVKSVQYA